jgi:hypothetical protein
MTDERDDRVATALQAAGDAWRSAQPPPPEPALPDGAATRRRRFGRPVGGPVRGFGWPLAGSVRRLPRSWRPLAVAAATVAVLATGLPSVLAAIRPQPAIPAGDMSASGSNQWALGPDTGAGWSVRGTGWLVQPATGGIRLCGQFTTASSKPPTTGRCGPIAVAVTGVDPGRLTHRTTDGVRYSDAVVVIGQYHNGSVAVDRVSPDPSGGSVFPSDRGVPCAEPSGGWSPGYGLSAVAQPGALDRLTKLVEAQPEVYTTAWAVHPAGGYRPAGSPVVYVVGTTGDLTAARAALAAAYPGNLCVHPVAYGQTGLEATARMLSAIDSTPIDAEIDPFTGTVLVTVVALDPHTQAALSTVDPRAVTIAPPLLVPAT